MEKRYQIFVSSTYSDLSQEREYVIHGLTKVGFIAVGMEQFPATEEEQMEYIRPIIDEADYYIVIIRGKYGSTAKDNISFTQRECEYAASAGKPILAFLFRSPEKLKISETDQDPKKMKKLDLFKKSLESKKIVKYWNNREELLNAVKDSVHDIVRRRPGIGWIRGDQALDPKIYKELESLRSENVQLKELVLNYEDNLNAPSDHLSHGADKVELTYTITVEDHEEDGQKKTLKTCWDELFDALTEIIYREFKENDIEKTIAYWISNKKRILNKNQRISSDSLKLNSHVTKKIRQQFEALNLIETFTRIEETSVPIGMYAANTRLRKSNVVFWRFTAYGRKYAVERAAIHKSKDPIII